MRMTERVARPLSATCPTAGPCRCLRRQGLRLPHHDASRDQVYGPAVAIAGCLRRFFFAQTIDKEVIEQDWIVICRERDGSILVFDAASAIDAEHE
jgi:hypothetical protein